MYSDFYLRKEDSNVVQDVLEIKDEISLLLTQIEMCLFTDKNEVIGQNNFGMNLQDSIFTFQLNESDLQEKILKEIYTHCPLSYKYDVNVVVNFTKNEIRDICLLDIVVNGESLIGILI